MRAVLLMQLLIENKIIHDQSVARWGCCLLTFNTAASQTQTAYVRLRRRLTAKLITCQVAVEEHTKFKIFHKITILFMCFYLCYGNDVLVPFAHWLISRLSVARLWKILCLSHLFNCASKNFTDSQDSQIPVVLRPGS